MTAARILSIRDLLDESDPSVSSSQWEFDAHRRVSALMKRKYKTYLSEVTLNAVLNADGEEIVMQGRLDGLHRVKNRVIIHEIKPVAGHPAAWRNHPALDGARRQLLMYADLYLHAGFGTWENCEIGGADLILIGERGRSIVEDVDISHVSGLLVRRLKSYLLLKSSRHRTFILSDLLGEFIRKDEKTDRALQAAAWTELKNTKTRELLLSLPPGSGKTRVAMRWALQEAHEQNLPIIWITSKARGREEAFHELTRYQTTGIPLRVLWKTARSRRCSCLNPNADCPISRETKNTLFWDGCPELLTRDSWTDADIDYCANERGFCSQELHRYLESVADVIVADINYLIDESSIKEKRAIVVLDEAQNVVPRLRDRRQVTITRDELVNAMRKLPPFLKTRYSQIKAEIATRGVEGRDLVEQCADLCDALRHHAYRSPSFDVLRSISTMGLISPDKVAVAWCRTEPQPVLVAAFLDLLPEVSEMLRPYAKWLALSGSLPADNELRAEIFPPSRTCTCIELSSAMVSPVYIVPCLDFKYPLSVDDHVSAVTYLMQIRKRMKPTILVFGQNRDSNEVLSAMLNARGYSVLLDEDVDADWSRAEFIRPDFLFAVVAGSLAEAVNPPQNLLSCAAVLSPGYQPPDIYSELRHAMRIYDDDKTDLDEDSLKDFRVQSISRIIQAVGRVQRDPTSSQPVFLLNRDFTHKTFLNAWPRHWYIEKPHELICTDMKAALQKARSHARAN